MTKFFLVIVAMLLTAAAHVLASWQWSLLIPLSFTLYSEGRGWLAGMSIMAGAWLLLLGANVVLAPAEIARMLGVMSQLLTKGNAPAFVLPMLSIVFAALAGGLAGMLGASLRTLRNKS